MRAAAASALGAYGDQAPIARLIALVDEFEESSLVRSSVLQSVAKIQGSKAVPRLLLALHDPAWHVREMAALLLGQLTERNAISTLIDVFHNDPNPFVRSATIIALGQMKDEMVEAVLRAAAEDAEQYVRDAARQALAEEK